MTTILQDLSAIADLSARMDAQAAEDRHYSGELDYMFRAARAGMLAENRARAFGYCPAVQQAMRRTARRALRLGETPADCARRVVPMPHEPVPGFGGEAA